MSFSDMLDRQVRSIIRTQWNLRRGLVVPTPENVTLAGGAVRIDAAFLYADLASSSRIAKELDSKVAAKIIKCFLATSTRLVRHCGGTVISFDGDRILGIFTGVEKETRAAKCALHVNHVMREVIKPRFESEYESVRNASFLLTHGVGVDAGEVLLVRAGVRGTNDNVSIGRAPNLAAKLSDLRTYPYCSYITEAIYTKLNKTAIFSPTTGDDMWQKCSWTFLDEEIPVYRSDWWWAA